ncbi:hypothetical protein SETIT_1G373200v2 [Setaria italica]|uniref:Pentacotripeptide-repeat region of PRORP domain-containing protein n=1 Tax=Setaria italica TaxID=4555 RepID=A0A368PTR7_SETIT|nr:hypothetical protein SETIT_1G373200v2 [Setaria italica]
MAAPPQALTPTLHASFLCSLALVLLRAGRLSAASQIVSSFPASPPASLLRRLIPALASSGLAAAAVRFRPLPVDPHTLNSIILSYCNLRLLRPALSLLRPREEMCKRGVPFDGVTVNTVLVGLCRSGLVDEAARLTEMLVGGRGIGSLDVVGWNALIDGYCKVQDMAAALAVAERMRKQGVPLDVVRYNSLVAGFCHSGDASAAWDVVEAMKADGVEPNVVTYTAFIGEYCKRKGIEEAFNLYEGMVRLGVLPDVVTLSALVDGLCRDGWFSEAYALFREMDNIGAPPNHESFGLLGEMVSRGVVIDLVMYTAMMDCLGKEGEIEEVKDMLQHALLDNLTPNCVTYTVLIDAHCRTGNVDGAEQVLLQMEEKSVSPNVITFSSILNGLVKRGCLNKAADYMRKMKDSGIAPNVF